MAAAQFDIIIEESSDFVMAVSWTDSNGDPVDVTDYGALMVVKEQRSKQAPVIAKVDHTLGITVGTTDGQFLIRIPEIFIGTVTTDSGWYELIVHSDQDDITFNPVRLLEGNVTFSTSLIKLN